MGTPYRHQASVLGAGADCLGLVRGVWRGVIGEEPERAPGYTPDWAEALGEETLLDAARRHLARDRHGRVRAKATCCCSAWRWGRQPSMWRSFPARTGSFTPTGAALSARRGWFRGGGGASPLRFSFRELKTDG